MKKSKEKLGLIKLSDNSDLTCETNVSQEFVSVFLFSIYNNVTLKIQTISTQINKMKNYNGI